MSITHIYKIFAEEVASIDFACAPGCATCCTRSVNLTTAEGRLILNFLREQGRELPELPNDSVPLRPPRSANELAALYLAGGEEEGEEEAPWLFEPCFFLRDGLCSIYAVRPFACRSFGSTVNCGETGEAMAPDWVVSLAIVTNQILEELDQGGFWGNLADILAFLSGGEEDNYLKSGRLLANRPLSGFLLLPEERARIARFLAKIGWPGRV